MCAIYINYIFCNCNIDNEIQLLCVAMELFRSHACSWMAYNVGIEFLMQVQVKLQCVITPVQLE